MKKFFLSLTVLLLTLLAGAQSIESIKTLATLRQYSKAKSDLDKAWTNAKFTAKPEAYLLKAVVYAGLANDASVKGTPTADQYITEADAAFTKYKELDPSMSLITDPVYQDGPLIIYSSYYSACYKDYEAKNWQAGLQKAKKAVDYSDLLFQKKMVGADTNSVLLAAVLATNAGQKDEAAKYYKRLADMKLSGKEFQDVYQFLVMYYAGKNDDANFEKYLSLGKELYPQSEFFKYDKLDFLLDQEKDFDKRIKLLEDYIAANPTNEKAINLLGGLIYDTLYSEKEGATPPANAAALEPKMINALTKAASMNPGDEMNWILLSNIYIKKRDKVDEARQKHVEEMKSRTKPGTQPSKQDVTKRDSLDAQYARMFLAAEDPLLKAAAIFEKKPKPLSGIDIQRYKYVVGYLGELATFKKNKAKGNAADVAKYTADEKKWNDLYEEVGKMKPKPKE